MTFKKNQKKKEVTVTLSEPVEFGEETVEEITLRRPKGKDLRKLPSEMDVGAMMDFAGRLSGREPSFMDLLDIDDVLKITEEVEGFLDSGRKTGSKG